MIDCFFSVKHIKSDTKMHFKLIVFLASCKQFCCVMLQFLFINTFTDTSRVQTDMLEMIKVIFFGQFAYTSVGHPVPIMHVFRSNRNKVLAKQTSAFCLNFHLIYPLACRIHFLFCIQIQILN